MIRFMLVAKSSAGVVENLFKDDRTFKSKPYAERVREKYSSLVVEPIQIVETESTTERDQLLDRIRELEAKLAAAGLSC